MGMIIPLPGGEEPSDQLVLMLEYTIRAESVNDTADKIWPGVRELSILAQDKLREASKKNNEQDSGS